MSEVDDLRAQVALIEEQYGHLSDAYQAALAANEQLARAIIPGDLVSRFTVPASYVVAKERPREGQGRFYTPRRTKDAEKVIGSLFIAGRVTPGGGVDGESIFSVHCDFYGSRADVDNLAKTVLDGLNKIAYADDRQVRELWARHHDGEKRAQISVYRRAKS